MIDNVKFKIYQEGNRWRWKGIIGHIIVARSPISGFDNRLDCLNNLGVMVSRLEEGYSEIDYTRKL